MKKPRCFRALGPKWRRRWLRGRHDLDLQIATRVAICARCCAKVRGCILPMMSASSCSETGYGEIENEALANAQKEFAKTDAENAAPAPLSEI